MSFLQVLFSFTGRINRAKYWLAALLWTAVSFVMSIALLVYIIQKAEKLENLSSEEIVMAVIAALGASILVLLVVVIPMIISGFAVGIKRLHDRDKSGWWILLFYLGPSVVSAIGASSASDVVNNVLQLAAFAIWVWALVELGFLRGTVGPNQYGPDPLAPAQGAAAV